MSHIIVDFFGTIADSDPNLLCAPRGQLMRFGEDRWMVQEKPEHVWFEEYTNKHGGDAEELKECFTEMSESIHFFDGAKKLIKTLSNKHQIHLLSNTGKSLRDYLDKHPEFTKQFTSITLSCEAGIRKPNEKIFKLVLDKINAKPEQCLMIGDSIRDDIKPAAKLGMKTIQFKGRKQPIQDLHKEISKLL